MGLVTGVWILGHGVHGRSVRQESWGGYQLNKKKVQKSRKKRGFRRVLDDQRRKKLNLGKGLERAPSDTKSQKIPMS